MLRPGVPDEVPNPTVLGTPARPSAISWGPIGRPGPIGVVPSVGSPRAMAIIGRTNRYRLSSPRHGNDRAESTGATTDWRFRS